VNMARDNAGEKHVSLQTIQRVLNSEYWAHGKTIWRPALDDAAKARRLAYAHLMLEHSLNTDFAPKTIRMMLDEKWYVATFFLLIIDDEMTHVPTGFTLTILWRQHFIVLRSFARKSRQRHARTKTRVI